jgi:hypothetical protein
VVDKKPPADGSARMDFDTGQKSRNLGNKTRENRNSRRVHPVRQPVEQDGMKTRIAENNFKNAFGGRVPEENGVDLFPDQAKHASGDEAQ